MLELRVFAGTDILTALADWLERTRHGQHVVAVPATVDVHSGLLWADIAAESAHEVLNHLATLAIDPVDIALIRSEDIGPRLPAQRASSLVWADMIGQARRNARPIARYIVFMLVAGVIAGYGVITVNSTLIVGAMAVSPDTLPVAAACVAFVGGRWRLAGRAVITLLVGLAAAGLAAALIGGVLNAISRLPSGFSADESVLSGLVTIGTGTVGVALAAGVAGMLALETRASSAVGVAISVTTIPAAAYFGVALVIGQTAKAAGALAVLGVNISMLLIGGTATLLVQRWLNERRRPTVQRGRT